MKAMKRWTALVLAMAMALALASCGGGSQSAAPAGSGSAAPAASGTAAPADDGDPVYGGTFTTYWSEYYNEYDASANDNRNFIDLYCNSLWAVDVDKTDTSSARDPVR